VGHTHYGDPWYSLASLPSCLPLPSCLSLPLSMSKKKTFDKTWIYLKCPHDDCGYVFRLCLGSVRLSDITRISVTVAHGLPVCARRASVTVVYHAPMCLCGISLAALIFACLCLAFGLYLTCMLVHGTWYMVHGTWYMVHGTWYMVHGTWYMVHGTWYMVHGTWYMEAFDCMHGGTCRSHE
jgi:hypothetical protein